MSSEDIAEVVKEINEHIFEISEDVEYVLWLDHVVLPVGEYVKYAGQYIFDSENDYREYVDYDEGIRQDLKEYLLEQIEQINNFIRKTLTVPKK